MVSPRELLKNAEHIHIFSRLAGYKDTAQGDHVVAVRLSNDHFMVGVVVLLHVVAAQQRHLRGIELGGRAILGVSHLVSSWGGSSHFRKQQFGKARNAVPCCTLPKNTILICMIWWNIGLCLTFHWF